jgi:hypothetical protein
VNTRASARIHADIRGEGLAGDRVNLSGKRAEQPARHLVEGCRHQVKL